MMTLDSSIPKRFNILIDPVVGVPPADRGHVAAADHDQVLHQIRMKALTYLQQERLFLIRFQGQFGITPPEIGFCATVRIDPICRIA
jgi:hypothetical protein